MTKPLLLSATMPNQNVRKRGRPASGPDGAKVSKYPQLTVRLPVETKARLTTLSLLMATPVWKIIDTAVETFVQHLPEDERKLIGSVADRLARGDWPVTSHWTTAWSTGLKAESPRVKRTRAAAQRPSRD
jgi:predicted DNA-binding protein